MIQRIHDILVVPGVRVQKSENHVTGSRINHLVNPRKGELVLKIGLVETYVVDTQLSLPALLIDWERVGQPVRVLNLLDEACGQKLGELFADYLPFLLVEAAEMLLHKLGLGLDFEAVLSDLMGMLGMSEAFHAIMLVFSRRNSIRAASMSWDMLAPMRISF